MENLHVLSIILFLPLAAGLVCLALPRTGSCLAGRAAFCSSLIELALGVLLYASYDPRGSGYQFDEHASWIPSIGAGYHIGVDGISLGLVLLTAFLTPLVIWYVLHRMENASNGHFFT